MRTSATHPLEIDGFDLARGRVGMTLCPGRKGSSISGADWNRDLAADVEAIRRWEADIVISLTETEEMARLGAGDLGGALREAGIEWLHLPIRDVAAPAPDWHAKWRSASGRVHQRLEAGGRVMIHCRAGLERTAVAAALLQCERGESLADALHVIAHARGGAGPLPHQRRWLEEVLAEGDRERQLIRASLFGGAIGDALGAEIEFWSLAQIRARFPGGLDRILPHDGLPAAVTDDTQMTLFTAEGLIRAAVRGHQKGVCHPASVVHHALLRWLATQGETVRVETIDRDTGLILDPRLHRRRAPGNTCLSALRASRHFGEMARNDSKGCGTIMRVAPIGLCGAGQIDSLADECSHLTHGHPTGRDAARAWVHLLARVLAGQDLAEAAQAVLAMAFEPATRRMIEAALRAPTDGRPETIERLGGGWVAEEALAIALYAGRVASGFEDGLRIAATHSGDSDSTAAIAGNLLGLLFPAEAMAHDWRRQVECADLIDRIAGDLHRARRGGGDDIDRLAVSYPGW